MWVIQYITVQAECTTTARKLLPWLQYQQDSYHVEFFVQQYLYLHWNSSIISSNTLCATSLIWCTAHSGSIQTPWLFPNFATLQAYSKNALNKSSSICSQYPLTTNGKQAMRLENWAPVHPVSIDHPWDVSTTWLESTCGTFNWLDRHTPVYIRSHSRQCMSEQKPSHRSLWDGFVCGLRRILF
jgi:hypothetical protein